MTPQGDTLSIIYIAPNVVELELALFAAACKCQSSRRKLLFMLKTHHFSDFLRANPTEGAEDEPDWPRLQATLEMMTDVSQLPTDPMQLESALCARDPLLFKLVRWILNSAAGFLVEVQDPEFLAAVGIPRIFLFHPDNHDKLARFDALKARSDVSVTYAFHGSRGFNWFSILRDGLLKASHTPLMSTGAAYGSGIYLGKEFMTSLTYCGDPETATSRSLGCGWRCMGLCEIAHTAAEDRGTMFVVEEADRVLLRALLVFDESTCKMTAEAIGQRLKNLALYQELHALQGTTSAAVAQV